MAQWKLKYQTLFLTILIIIIFSTGCHDSFNECLNGPGKTTTLRMGLYNFGNLKITDNINLTLQNGDNYEIEITAGENIIPMLGININNNTLILSNNSTCPMLKDPWKKIEITLTVPTIDTIFVENHGALSSTSPFIEEDLYLNIYDTPANINLNVACEFLKIENLSGTAQVKISGETKAVECFHSGYGPIDLTQLTSKYMYINMQSSNDSYIRASEVYFYAALNGIGDVYYYNNPQKLDLTTGNTGKLIQLY